MICIKLPGSKPPAAKMLKMPRKISTPNSYFERLPTEILGAIISQTTSSASLKLMLTNSTMHQKVEPFLYEHIEWNIERTYEKPTLHKFLHKILARPEVGLWVRSFAMVGRFEQKSYTHLHYESTKRLFQLALISHPDLLENPKSDEWLCMFYQSPSPIMLVSLLLLFCPNIHTLSPWSGYPESAPRLLFLSRAIAKLPNLRAIDYGTGFTKFTQLPWCDQSISFLYHLESVRSLRLQVTEPILGSKVAPYPDYLVAPHIIKLDLHSSLLSERSIEKLITKLPNLRNLKLGLLRETYANSADSMAVGSFLDCGALGKAFLPLQSSLESLTITTEFYVSREIHRWKGGPYLSGREGNPGTMYYWGTKGTINTLRSFSRLTYLEIDPLMLLGWDVNNTPDLREVLPRNLKTLVLRTYFSGCRAWTGRVPWLRDLMKQFFGNEERLESLVVGLLESHSARYVKELEELSTICDAVGVKFTTEKTIG